MREMLMAAGVAAVLGFAGPAAAQEGLAAGAVTGAIAGAIVGGPIGALIGAGLGGTVGGTAETVARRPRGRVSVQFMSQPPVVRRTCVQDRFGRRTCAER
jgi:hypothetical protein